MAIPNWANKIQSLRVPNCGRFNVSMTGPQIHLKVQGKATVANRIPIS